MKLSFKVYRCWHPNTFRR